ncbi:site-specific DNA-methyltransferase [Candidatus Magnetomonas plexicatena]|uniref:site-specific DNA-methyltransferase n=1 Tax=Candidatus Magnetomonas plexicatena TaxID=2552947 RepID=UPI0011006927
MERLDKEGKIFYTKKGIPRLKRYIDESKGILCQDLWIDLEALRSWHIERLGYPTQKPLALLERIITASSNEGDIVLDPFCGCGTTVTAAQKLNRQWIGIDITHLAINLIKLRLKDMFSIEPKRGSAIPVGKDYAVIGEPEDLAGAKELASQNRYQFQWWALSLIAARPYGDKKKGKDSGIDGYVYFVEGKNIVGKGIVSVKSSHVSVKDIRDLGHVIERDNAKVGIFITLEQPTRDMKTEAVSAGYYKSPATNRDYPRIQIFTIEDLFNGQQPQLPLSIDSYKKAEYSKPDDSELDF